jgi:hypothetical protein
MYKFYYCTYCMCICWYNNKKTWSLLFNRHFGVKGSRDGVVGLVPRLQAGRPRNRGSILGSGERFLFSPKLPD